MIKFKNVIYRLLFVRLFLLTVLPFFCFLYSVFFKVDLWIMLTSQS